MAIFSRRDIQRMLDHNASFCAREALREHVRRLNRCDEQSIATEWEVAVLYGLSKIGSVSHEEVAAGSARLDVTFQSFDGSVTFIGDVAAVTDFGIEEQNPLRSFLAEIARRKRKRGLTRFGFFVGIGARYLGEGFDRKVLLALPPRSKFGEFFDGSVEAFFSAVASERNQGHSVHRQSPEIDVTLTFDPKEKGGGAHYLNYSIPQSLTRNPFFHCLDGKAAQFKRASASGTTVIFACDGGAGAVRRILGGSVYAYRPDQIVRRFFEDHNVSAVCLLTVEPQTSPNSLVPFSGPPASRVSVFTHPTLTQLTEAGLRHLLAHLPSCLPKPVIDVPNAINHLRSRHRRTGLSFRGGARLTGGSMRISVRALQELLAGTLSQEEFFAVHRFVGAKGGRFPNKFAVALQQGRLIENVTIQKCSSDDDDWIEFHFSAPDPAIARFREPPVASDVESTKGDSRDKK